MITGRRHAEIVRELQRSHREREHAWNEERKTLLDRIMVLADKPLPDPVDRTPREDLPPPPGVEDGFMVELEEAL